MDEKTEQKKIILSGIQPTGGIHIGNYIGAVRNWVAMQDKFKCFYTIVDLHSITIRQVPAELRKNTLDMAAILIAGGIDPEKSALFVQSHVPEHSLLAWVLNCYCQLGELNRMTQFKEKAAKHSENINVGLFTYPVLQAADILLYQADMVPVGEDQKQHLELTRDIANRFNNTYSPTFKLPEPFIPPIGARIMSLQEPEKKMSKSDENQKATIFLSDNPNEIRNKIKRAVTDSDGAIDYALAKPGIKNLMSLYSIATGRSYDAIKSEFAGQGYGSFKAAVADTVVSYLAPIQEKYAETRSDKKRLQEILAAGADEARRTAMKTLRKVYKKIGLVQF